MWSTIKRIKPEDSPYNRTNTTQSKRIERQLDNKSFKKITGVTPFIDRMIMSGCIPNGAMKQ